MNRPRPLDITLHQASRVLEVSFDNGEQFRLPYEYLRVNSPSAEVQGHGKGQKVLVAGKQNVGVEAIEPTGHYGILIRFDDGHASGIFGWDILYDLGRAYDTAWPAYLAELEAKGLSR
ncbi:gamma-butyrobetaine hydroxylase-like domain-containing protein [Luteibacter sp.]|jgi:DUF971 family protein|uniref:gamma-butyrobetaine hydroxylase-like domain-containing protein n=1 Tax=Luteibacter sp. TaxID=1886636 RepID=UPI003F803921